MRRLATGGLIDRTRPLRFTFDGVAMGGFAGDTLASALLANGQSLVARSLKYHRPRGLLSAGLEEPSALVSVEDARGRVPNLKATEVVLQDGMRVTSQNTWPSLRYDAGAVLGLTGGLLAAGFYYKTFKWPRNGWSKRYAPLIRRLAGHGAADLTAPLALGDKRQRNCDVLVIGAGAAGLSAALTAAQSGATTVLLDQDTRLGGALLDEETRIEGMPCVDWAQDAQAALATLSNVTVMARSLAFGHYDHGLVLAVETLPPGQASTTVLWKIRARRILLAAGAYERPVVFPGNDRPGVMLAGAVRRYIRRFAVAPGRRAVLAIADPVERQATEAALISAGITVAAQIEPQSQILATRGRRHLRAVVWRDPQGGRHRVACDLLCVSTGWMPNAQLYAQMGGALRFDHETQSLMPKPAPGLMQPIGGARGLGSVADCLRDGKAAAHTAMAELEMHKHLNLPRPSPSVASPGFAAGPGQAFVDLQNDVTRSDIALAAREGYRNVELTKRYTTLGMGTDQGKTSWTNGILEIAALTGRDPAEIGHTTFRPPVSPIPIGALVGAEIGTQMRPVRRTPFHRAFETVGCVFQTSGDWLYARYFPQTGETMAQAVLRETCAVRQGLGCVDMSTLGKIDVQGPDALTFLSRLYCNDFAKIKPGGLRYGLMLREDGYVFDDGVIARLSAHHFVVTATTANAASVWRHMRKLAQVDWADLDVTLTDVSDQWAALAIAGPRARDLLQALEPDFDTARSEFPFAAVREGHLGGDLPVRAMSVSFSGELSYEINTPAGFAGPLLRRIMAEGAAWGITPYGLETLDVLRIEKGHLSVGTEIDGRRTPADLGLGGIVSRSKDFVGKGLLQRPALQAQGRETLVGLVPQDGTSPIPPGAILSDTDLSDTGQAEICGHLTAAIESPTLGHPIALGLLAGGADRMGDVVWAHSPVAGVSLRVKVAPVCAYDPTGDRMRG